MSEPESLYLPISNPRFSKREHVASNLSIANSSKFTPVSRFTSNATSTNLQILSLSSDTEHSLRRKRNCGAKPINHGSQPHQTLLRTKVAPLMHIVHNHVPTCLGGSSLHCQIAPKAKTRINSNTATYCRLSGVLFAQPT